jgi:hypothetical protein
LGEERKSNFGVVRSVDDPIQTSNVPIKETILEHGLVGAPALIE